MEKPNITVFFPVFNDEKTVKLVAEKALKVLEKYAGLYEVLIINDGSPDNSGKIADELAKENNNIKVIHHETNLGYGAALRTGFSNSKYELICQTDGDDEYDISDLGKFIKLKDFYDLIITFRYVRMYSTWRIFISRAYNSILRLLFRHNFRDISTGLRFVRKEVLNEIELTSNSPFIGAELTIKAMLKGYRIGEVGIQTFPREFGKGASVSFSNIKNTIIEMTKIYRHIFSKDYELPKERNR